MTFSETFLMFLVTLVVFLGVKFGLRKSCLCITIPHICHFFYTSKIFENQILHPKKRLKAPKTLKMSLRKSIICIFFHLIWKNLHLTENFYTDMSVVSMTNMRYAHALWVPSISRFSPNLCL